MNRKARKDFDYFVKNTETGQWINSSLEYSKNEDDAVKFTELGAKLFISRHIDGEKLSVYVHDKKLAEILKEQESPDYMFGKGFFEFEDK